MANPEQLAILKQGVKVWNQWRIDNPDIEIDLIDANLSSTNLSGADLSLISALATNFEKANLTGACIEDWYINGQTNVEGGSLRLYLSKVKTAKWKRNISRPPSP